jgi:hypothetical protein
MSANPRTRELATDREENPAILLPINTIRKAIERIVEKERR